MPCKERCQQGDQQSGAHARPGMDDFDAAPVSAGGWVCAPDTFGGASICDEFEGGVDDVGGELCGVAV